MKKQVDDRTLLCAMIGMIDSQIEKFDPETDDPIAFLMTTYGFTTAILMGELGVEAFQKFAFEQIATNKTVFESKDPLAMIQRLCEETRGEMN